MKRAGPPSGRRGRAACLPQESRRFRKIWEGYNNRGMVALQDIVESHRELALALGVHRQTVLEWAQKPDFPRNSDGTYSISAVKAWRDKWQQKTPGDLRERRLLAECIKLELANEETRKELVKLSDVKAEFVEMLAGFKAILDAMPDAIAKDSPEEQRVESRRNARHHCDLALRKMAAWGKRIDVESAGRLPDGP